MKLKKIIIGLSVISCALLVALGWEPIMAAPRKILTTLSGKATVSLASITNRGTVNASQSSGILIGGGLIGYWRFDGPDINASAVVADASGGGHTGSIANSPHRVPGVAGQGLQLYDPPGTRQYMAIASYSDIEADIFTATFWMKGKGTSQLEGFARIISKTGSATNNPGWEIMVNGTSADLRLRFDTSAGAAQDTLITNTADDQWHFVALTVNAGSFEPYVDGVSQGTGSYTAGTGLANAGQNLTIGVRSNNVNNAAFAGFVDEVRMYNRVLSAAEISLLYNSAKH